MHTMSDDKEFKQSRRNVMKSVIALAGTAAVAGLAGHQQAHAASKLPKSAVQYQDKPNGDKDCSKCVQFIPGASASADGTCKVVEGAISPHGYCIAFSPKA
jgi:hypothetical protein